jgi:uncharacterized protein
MEDEIRLANLLFEQRRFNEAFDKYRALAESGFVGAQLRVAWMLQTGCGVESNSGEAYRWYLKAAERESPEALFYLGRFNRAEKKYAEAFRYFQESARKHYMPAVYQLGVMHELGEGVEVDKTKAFAYYDQAASIGHLRAQRDKAVLMIKGQVGLWRIPEGLLILLRVLRESIKMGLKEPDSDKLRW